LTPIITFLETIITLVTRVSNNFGPLYKIIKKVSSSNLIDFQPHKKYNSCSIFSLSYFGVEKWNLKL
jgi:hypothetical protein